MDLEAIKTPAFVLEESKLIRNLSLLQRVSSEAGVQIILALKAFALWQTFPLIKKYLSGATASSLNEARLIYEEMGVKAHVYSPAYLPSEMKDLVPICSHITFNSITQFEAFYPQVAPSSTISCGLRVNPEISPVEVPLYNPAAKGSRLGISPDQFKGKELPEGVEGLHFHVLCESDATDLERVLQKFEQDFQPHLHQLKWVNFGGGHLITKEGYEIDRLIQLLADFRRKYELEIILEPGSAIAWQTGPLIASVLDMVDNRGIKTAILDISFTAHMPDVLEMPYRPVIRNASDLPKSNQFHCRLGGVSCLAGDYLEAYGFDRPLIVGDKLYFEDMIHYTMVKTTFFNGVKHPDIVVLDQAGEIKHQRSFDYQDFKNRLG